jgi:UDP-glucose 4-epimerase
VALRFGNVYGPGSNHKSSVVAKFIRDAIASGVLRINGNGSQTRDFIYIEDLLDAILAAAQCPNVGGEVFQIATARETSVGELAELVCRLLPKYGIAAPTLAYDAFRLGDVQRNFSDTTKARTHLGWSARVALDEGLDRTIAWFVGPGTPFTKVQ